ncbi:MAG: carbon-phosphorus lyase complex subunit PhnI [Chloroflexota bacterium]|nr:carbon-phosphorus lyase complex subunit PhnI [Chloroflexota bacterium]
MGYVATKGGTEAVLKAEQLVEYFRLRGESEPIRIEQIQDQFRLAVDRAMGEGSLYAPALAALALKQSEGDAVEASFLLRAYRSTLPRLSYSLPTSGARMRAIRRISSTFKDIPGGQLLGPTRDYQPRLLNTLLNHESSQTVRRYLADFEAQVRQNSPSDGQVGYFPKVIESMRAQGIMAEAEKGAEEEEPFDVTRKAISFPAPRSVRLQILTRGDNGSLLAFAYSSIRGYGDVHPTLGEMRVGYLPVEVNHPLTGEVVEIGEILATECEMVSRVKSTNEAEEESSPKFGLGYGFSFGHGEDKAVSMAILDRVLSASKAGKLHGQSGPAANEEFVLLHVDAIEASGFTAHYKLPHYVTFQADIRVLERAKDHATAKSAESAEKHRRFRQKLALPTEADEVERIMPDNGEDEG